MKNENPELTKICIWSDLDWCMYESLEEYMSFKSDDYMIAIVYFDDEPTEEELTEHMASYLYV